MVSKIKEKVLKDEILRNKIQKYINFEDKESRDKLDEMLAELFHQGKEQALAEVGKVIDELEIRKKKIPQANMGERNKWFVDYNDIEKLKQKLGIK